MKHSPLCAESFCRFKGIDKITKVLFLFFLVLRSQVYEVRHVYAELYAVPFRLGPYGLGALSSHAHSAAEGILKAIEPPL